MKEEEKAIILYPYDTGALGIAIIISCLICFVLGLIIGWLIK